MFTTDFFNSIVDSLSRYGQPILLISSLILLGVLVGWLVKQAIINLLNLLNIPKFTKNLGLDKVFGAKVKWSDLLGDLAQWVIIFVFLLWALSFFGSTEGVQVVIRNLIGYLPQVIGAVAVVLIGAVVADLLSRFVENVAKVLGASTAVFLGDVAKYSVLITVFLTALSQLGIKAEFLETLYSALVWALAGAFILAFGLGGQEAARDLMNRVKQNWPNK